PPTVTTLAATNVMSTSARLGGSSNPNGNATTGWFRYSTTNPGTCNDTFGTRAAATSGIALGSGISEVDYYQDIAGLTPETPYYYCAIAGYAGGVVFGSVRSFIPPPPPPNCGWSPSASYPADTEYQLSAVQGNHLYSFGGR